jgi:carotenoid cleavage dioxygenase-like enzyme
MTKDTETSETSDINLATFIKAVKNCNTAGHYFKGDQLVIKFHMSKEKMRHMREDYLNSPFANYDATKKNLLQLLKR